MIPFYFDTREPLQKTCWKLSISVLVFQSSVFKPLFSDLASLFILVSTVLYGSGADSKNTDEEKQAESGGCDSGLTSNSPTNPVFPGSIRAILEDSDRQSFRNVTDANSMLPPQSGGSCCSILKCTFDHAVVQMP